MILLILITMIASWINRHQQQVMAYILAENHTLRAKLGDRRLRFTSAERCRLAALAFPLGRKRLKSLATLATPDTLMGWYKRLMVQKFDGSQKRIRDGGGTRLIITVRRGEQTFSVAVRRTSVFRSKRWWPPVASRGCPRLGGALRSGNATPSSTGLARLRRSTSRANPAFRVLFVFIPLAHERWRIVYFNITEHPTAQWTAQQIVEAFPWDEVPRYLL